MSLDVSLRCSSCGHDRFSANITHNLTRMADAAGIYLVVWRPEEVGASKACDLVNFLSVGVSVLRSDPDRFKQFNPSNGWGSYDGFLSTLEKYLSACKQFPDAEIHVSR